MSFVIQCEQSIVDAGHCPLPLTNNGHEILAVIRFHLTSENFCPVFLADVGVSATLNSYQDNLFALAKDDFLSDSTAFFRAITSSPIATIVETKLHSVRVSSGGGPETTLYSTSPAVDAGVVVPTNWLRSGSTPSIHPTWSSFSLHFDPAIFGVLQDQHQTFTIGCTLDVVFLNTEGLSFTSRREFTVVRTLADSDDNVTPVGAQTLISFSRPPSSKIAEPASGLSSEAFIGVVSGAGAVGTVFLVAFVVFCYRRSKATSAPSSLSGATSTAVGEQQLVPI